MLQHRCVTHLYRKSLRIFSFTINGVSISLVLLNVNQNVIPGSLPNLPMATIRLETFIDAPVERVFDLARSIDLHKLSMKRTREEAIAGRTSGLINVNESVTWKATHFGIPQKLTVVITQFERPNMFVDKMTKGIFSTMEHTHLFETVDTQTKMTNIFEFKAPLGLLGRLLEIFFLKAYMTRFLELRNKALKSTAESKEWSSVLTGK